MLQIEVGFHRKFSGNFEMGSAGIDDSSQKAIEPELIDVGSKLLRRPSSTSELLSLLDKAENLLAKVWQQPPRSTCRALFQTMKALITDELLHNDDLNIQIAVASCCNELTRITAPEFPYGDDTMRVIFQLFMVAFEQLSCESGRNYNRALHIVETVAKVRSFLMLLDVDCDVLVVDMFQLFLNHIRSNHPSDIFTYMEFIMTMVIEESDEISFSLLRPLLASVKMKNKDTSLISWELGKKVLENCATKLQCYLREAVKAMDLEFDDYAEIVACICHDTFDENNTVSKEALPTANGVASQIDGLSKDVREYCFQPTDDGNITKLDNENLPETVKDSHQTLQSVVDKGSLRKRRRKPSSTIRPQEYEHTLKAGDRYSHEGSPGYNEEKRALPSEEGNLSMLSNSSRNKVDSSSEVSLPKNVQSKKKKSMINQDEDLDLSSILKSKIMKLKERVHDAPQKTGKMAIAGSGKMRVAKEGGVIGDARKEEKHQLAHKELSGRKEILSQKYAAQKMEGFPMSKSAKANSGKKQRRPRVGYGEKLVNLRIQVWWPMDEKFYPGTIKAFDPETEKYEILYDDNEVEILNLRKEKWKLFCDEQPLQKQEADHSSRSRELIETKEKNTKRKVGLFKKQQQHANASLSKRSKGENHGLSKSGYNSSSPGFHQVRAESEEETCETNVSAKDDRGNRVGKENSEILTMKPQSDHIQEDEKIGNF